MSINAFFRQPQAVFLLAFVQLWNRFSHYGMRALLVLYMVKELQLADSMAFGIYAVYCGLVELGGLFGVFVAERFLGLRHSVMLGGWIIGLGHLLLAFGQFLPGLACVIVGSSLYSTNIAVLLGDCYTVQDERREQGFTLFYMGINAGAFLATILCGYLAENYGWNVGFGLAAMGMLIANGALFWGRHLLPEQKIANRKRLFGLCLFLLFAAIATFLALQTAVMSSLMPWIGLGCLGIAFARLLKRGSPVREKIPMLLVALLALIAFFAAEEQIGSSLLLYTERLTEASAFPASIILAINPLVIILLGVAASILSLRIKNPLLRLGLPFAIGACGLLLFAIRGEGFSIYTAMSGVALLSFAELLVGPTTYSLCSQVASAKKDPRVMTLVPIGFSLAASIGGVFSKQLAGVGNFSAQTYAEGFSSLAGLLLIIGVLLGLADSLVKKRLRA